MGKTGLYQYLCEWFKEDKKLTKWWFELYEGIVLFALLVFVFSTFYGFFPTKEPMSIKLLAVSQKVVDVVKLSNCMKQ